MLSALVVALAVLNVWTFSTQSSEIGTLQSQLSLLNKEFAILNTKFVNLTDIVNLAKSTVLINHQTVGQPANSYSYWEFPIPYAVYLSVNVESSTSPNTYVQVLYNTYSVVYDETTILGTAGTGVFPVLPTNEVTIRVGNTSQDSDVTETITITYHY